MWTSDGLIILPECIQLKKALLAVFLWSMERSNWQFCKMQGENAGFICADASVTISILIDMTEKTTYYNQIWNPWINHTPCKFPNYGYFSLLDNYNVKLFIVIHQKCQNTCTSSHMCIKENTNICIYLLKHSRTSHGLLFPHCSFQST